MYYAERPEFKEWEAQAKYDGLKFAEKMDFGNGVEYRGYLRGEGIRQGLGG